MTLQDARFGTDQAGGKGAARSDLAIYTRHVEEGVTIRALAREFGTHPSTIMRQVRRVEAKRDDPLYDMAVDGITKTGKTGASVHTFEPGSEREFRETARLVLMALNRPGACLAVVPSLEMAVVVQQTKDNSAEPLAVKVKRLVAERMALLDWIRATTKARVIRYEITAPGRSALRRMVADEESRRVGGDAANPFGDQHRVMQDGERGEGTRRRHVRYNAAESPVTLLAKHKDGKGQPFLTADLVASAERLREDFELAQIGPRVTQDWDRFLTAGTRGQFQPDRDTGGAMGARERVGEALRVLGPGLGDVALRVCCFLEGMEAAEKRFGWSARSGKIVLRIALQRLLAHYQSRGNGPMIG
jgi:hypothetical protein